MSLIQKMKGNNFSPSVPRSNKPQQITVATNPNSLSFTLSSNKFVDPKRQHRKPLNKHFIPAFPTKEDLVKTSSDKESYKENGKIESKLASKRIGKDPVEEEKNTYRLPIENLYLPPSMKTNLSNPEKARMIREINLKIQLLQSKSKQPGMRLQDLHPLREEIYNKFDQYYITNKMTRSRFIDNDKNQVQNQKVTAFPSRIRKDSKELQAHLKMDSKTSSPHSSLSRKSFCLENAKLSTSNALHSCGDDERINCKIYKTMANISVVSLTHRSNNEQEEQRPVFETQLSEKEMIQLDREPERKMSEQSQDHHDSYIELKQNVRIMEERIGFLIHRLEENKKEISFLKESRDRFEKRCYEKQKHSQKIIEDRVELNNNYLLLQLESKRLKEKYEDLEKQNAILENQNLQFEKSISQLTNEIEYLSEKLKMKENESNLVEELLIQKKCQCEEIGHNLRSLQREFTKKRKQMLAQLEDKQLEKEELKSQIKEQKARMQIQGINFKFEEAAKLKKYIEENELLHQREIQKLDSSYSTVINTFQEENRRIKNQKIQLENTLIQWLGNYSKLEKQEKKLGEAHFKSELIKLEAIQLRMGELTGSHISSEFLMLLQNYSQLESEKNYHIGRNLELQQKWVLFKEEYQKIIQKKCEQTQNLVHKVGELNSMNKILQKEKEEIMYEIKVQNQKQKEIGLTTEKIKIYNLRMEQKNLHYNYPQPELAAKDHGTSFQKVMQKMGKVSLKRKLEIALKLIDLAQSFANKKKLPTLNPNCLIVQFNSLSSNDFSIMMSKEAKEEDQNLHYCSPQVLLGFNETHQSHCWTIGIILDKLIHGKEYFNQYSQIISRTENYMIRDQRYKSLQFLNEMLRKNQRQRISLDEVRNKIRSFLEISHLQ